MKSRHFRYPKIWTAAVLLSSPLLMGAEGNGCSPGGPVHIGSGTPSDDAGSEAATSDAGTSCTPADCAGLPATTEAKLCPDGTGVGRTVCSTQTNGQCAWDFPPCPSGND